MASINDTIIEVYELDDKNAIVGQKRSYNEHESVLEKIIEGLTPETKYRIEIYTPGTPAKVLFHRTKGKVIVVPLKTLAITDRTASGFIVRWT